MRRQAFSLVELLVVITIMLVLMGLAGAALSNARTSQKRQETQGLIAKLDAVIQQQFASYAGRDVPAPDDPTAWSSFTPAVYRSWFIRRHLINGDLPDRWVDVEYMASRSADFSSPHQKVYRAVWNSMNPKPSATHQGAECLFMIVMRGGIANCLDCGDLAGTRIGDKDQDGAFEFHDAWGNPIDFLLWPSAVEVPAGDGVKFFSGARALQTAFPTTGPAPQPALGMRPLIFSAGPDGKHGLETLPSKANLDAWTNKTKPPQVAGRDCGNWEEEPASAYGRWDQITPDPRSDNLTNYDAEAKQ
jgi:prepilin-type N-terminal cleavage/methylation domain-containing protein